MNLHNPTRYPDETREAYQERRTLSAQAVRIATKGPQQEPANPVELKLNPLIWRRYWLGQHHATPIRRNQRKLMALLGPRQYYRRYNKAYRFAALRRLTEIAQELNLGY